MLFREKRHYSTSRGTDVLNNAGVKTMTILSVSDASKIAGVSRVDVLEKIATGELQLTSNGLAVNDLISVYPNLAPLEGVKLRAVKQSADKPAALNKEKNDGVENPPVVTGVVRAETDAETISLLVRELEWNKELLERTNQQMARQLDEQRSLIADQARRLDEKDRFWGRQIEIAQSLLPAPTPRKRFFGLF